MRSLPRTVIVALGFLGAVTSASATERARPDDSARACPQHGAGFVQVPGTATCIRIGGRVRGEYGASTRRHVSGTGTSGRLSVDTRTDTAYGPLRTYVRVKAGSALDR